MLRGIFEVLTHVGTPPCVIVWHFLDVGVFADDGSVDLQLVAYQRSQRLQDCKYRSHLVLRDA